MNKFKRLFSFILFCLLTGSIGANFFLFSAAQKYYFEVQTTRFNPIGLAAYPETHSPKIDLPRFVFFGDSSSFEWPFLDYDQVEFVNRGIGAETSTQTLLRYDAHVELLEADIVLVQTCMNELKTIPLFPEKRKRIVSNCKENILALIELTERSDTVLILTTVFPAGPPSLLRRPFWSAEVANAVDEINQFIHLQNADHLIVFDTHALLVDESGGLNPDYARDQLHLNAVGYKRLNIELVLVLDEVVK